MARRWKTIRKSWAPQNVTCTSFHSSSYLNCTYIMKEQVGAYFTRPEARLMQTPDWRPLYLWRNSVLDPSGASSSLTWCVLVCLPRNILGDLDPGIVLPAGYIQSHIKAAVRNTAHQHSVSQFDQLPIACRLLDHWEDVWGRIAPWYRYWRFGARREITPI